MSDKTKVDRQTKVLKPSRAARPTVGSANESAPAAANLQKPINSAQDLAGGDVAALQQTYGNHFVQRLAGINGIDGDDAGVQPTTDIESEIEQTRGGGGQLPDAFRSKMEGHFKTDFKGVRVHTDGQADQLSRSLNAKAFTTGSDIYFRQGDYDPDSQGGQKLIAHELTHVVQQGGTQRKATQAKLSLNEPDDKYEKEADVVAEAAVKGDETKTAAATDTAAESQSGEPPAAVATNEDEVIEAAITGEDVEEKTGVSAGTLEKVSKDVKDGRDPETAVKQIADEKRQDMQGVEAKATQEAETPERAGEKSAESNQQKDKEKEEKEKEEKKEEEGETDKEAAPSAKKAQPPAADIPEPDAADDLKYDPDNLEEPELDDPLPTWGELAYGTVQLRDAPEEVAWRDYIFGIEGEQEESSQPGQADLDAAREAFAGRLGEDNQTAAGDEDLDRDAMIKDALVGGLVGGLVEGTSEFITDTIMSTATSKIPHADGVMAIANIAKDPEGWAKSTEKTFTGAFEEGGVFNDIGGRWDQEDTPAGRAAFVFEFILGIIDFVDGIIGFIKQIFSIAMAILAATAAVLKATAAVLAAIPGGQGAAAALVKVAAFLLKIVKFLAKLVKILSHISSLLGMAKPPLQMLIIICRAVDLKESQASPDDLRQKQAKLRNTTQAFVKGVTKRALNKAKQKIETAVSTRLEKSQAKKEIAKAEQEAQNPPQGKDRDELVKKAQGLKDQYEDEFGESHVAKDQAGYKTKEQVRTDREERAKTKFEQAQAKLKTAEDVGAPTDIKLRKAKLAEKESAYKAIQEKNKDDTRSKRAKVGDFVKGTITVFTGVDLDKKTYINMAKDFKAAATAHKEFGIVREKTAIKKQQESAQEQLEAQKAHDKLAQQEKDFETAKEEATTRKKERGEAGKTALDNRDLATQQAQTAETQATLARDQAKNDVDSLKGQQQETETRRQETETARQKTVEQLKSTEQQLDETTKIVKEKQEQRQQEERMYSEAEQRKQEAEKRLKAIETWESAGDESVKKKLAQSRTEAEGELVQSNKDMETAAQRRLAAENEAGANEEKAKALREQQQLLKQEQDKQDSALRKLEQEKQDRVKALQTKEDELKQQETQIQLAQAQARQAEDRYNQTIKNLRDQRITDKQALANAEEGLVELRKQSAREQAEHLAKQKESKKAVEAYYKSVSSVNEDLFGKHYGWKDPRTYVSAGVGGGTTSPILTDAISQQIFGEGKTGLGGQIANLVTGEMGLNAPEDAKDWAKKYGKKLIALKFNYEGGLPSFENDKVKEVKSSNSEEPFRIVREYDPDLVGDMLADMDFSATAPPDRKAWLNRDDSQQDPPGQTPQQKKEAYNQQLVDYLKYDYRDGVENLVKKEVDIKKDNSDNKPPKSFDMVVKYEPGMVYRLDLEEMTAEIQESGSDQQSSYKFEPRQSSNREVAEDDPDKLEQVSFAYGYEGDENYQQAVKEGKVPVGQQVSKINLKSMVTFPSGVEPKDQMLPNDIPVDVRLKPEGIFGDDEIEVKDSQTSVFVPTPFADEGKKVKFPEIKASDIEVGYSNGKRGTLEAAADMPAEERDRQSESDRKAGEALKIWLSVPAGKAFDPAAMPEFDVVIGYEAKGYENGTGDTAVDEPITVQRQAAPKMVKRAPGEHLVVQRAEDEEEEAAGPLGGQAEKPLEEIRREREIDIASKLPEPPNEAMQGVTGSALAYNSMNMEEYQLQVQQQEIMALQNETMAQEMELEAGQQVTAVNQQAMVGHQQEIAEHQQAQAEMEGLAKQGQEPAKESKDISGMLSEAISGVLTSLLQGLGLSAEHAGGGQNANPNQAGQGIKQQDSAAAGGVAVTKLEENRAKQWQAETRSIGADTSRQQQDMDAAGDMLADGKADAQEGKTELDYMNEMTQEQLEGVQEEKETQEMIHSDAYLEAEIWADEHYTMRQDMFAQLEAELEAEEERRAGM
jgi:hypothetical protein